MSDLKTRLAAAQQGNNESNQALDAILRTTNRDTTRQNMDLPLGALYPWSDDTNTRQPFRPYSPEKLRSLADDIARHGLLSPIVVRPWKDGYQILSGHNRVEAVKLLGWVTIPAVVLYGISDAEAADIMVSLNFNQRDRLLPSERAYGWKIKMDALRHQGTSSQDGTKSRSDELLAEQEGVGRNTIQRYIRLTRLTPNLLDLVDGWQYEQTGEWACKPDEPVIPLSAAETLTAMNKRDQELLADTLFGWRVKRLTQAQAIALREFAPAPLTAKNIQITLGLTHEGLSPEPKPVRLAIQAPAAQLSAAGLKPAQVRKYLEEDELREQVLETILRYVKEKGGGAG